MFIGTGVRAMMGRRRAVGGGAPATSWDLTYAVSSGVSQLMNPPIVSPQSSPVFSTDGTKLYVINGTTDFLYQFDLTTAWDITSITNFGSPVKFIDLSPPENIPYDIRFSVDGTKMYIVGTGGTQTVYQYSLSTAWEITTAALGSPVISYALGYSPRTLHFSTDGTKMYTGETSGDTIRQYHLSTAWDVSTAVAGSPFSFYIGLQEAAITGMFIKPDGTRLYIVGEVSDTVYQYDLSVPWEIGSASGNGSPPVSLSVNPPEVVPEGIWFKSDGTKMWMIGQGNDTIYEYDL